jgi:hypothetical protein
MLYYDRYEIELKIDGTVVDYPAANYIFSIRDSIYDLYPHASMSFNDSSGLFNEFLSFTNGTKVEIKFGNKDDFITCPFVIDKNSIPEQRTQLSFGGNTDISLIHEYYAKQNKQAISHNDEISNIIRKKARLYSFHNASSLDIDTTFNKGLWYQPLMTDSEFMVKNLLPFSFSKDSADSPFFLYIDINNDFHFKSLKKLLIDQKEIIELIHKEGLSLDALALDRILYINVYQSSYHSIKQFQKRVITKFNKSGVLEIENDYLKDYPSAPTVVNGKIPIKIDNTVLTGDLQLLDKDVDVTTSNEDNDNLGKKIFSMREALLLDKLIVTCNMNIQLRAGQKVKISVYNRDESDKTDLSYRYSGYYIIESSHHKWLGRTASTVLICGRQSMSIPNNYKNASLLVSK